MPRRLAATLLWTALLCWAAGVLWLSSLTPSELPRAAFLVWDKFNHFAAFAIGGWLAAGALRTSRPDGSPAVAAVVAVVLVAGFGAFDEFRQLSTPGRTGGDLHDWIADFLGASAGAIIARFTHGHLDRFITRP